MSPRDSHGADGLVLFTKGAPSRLIHARCARRPSFMCVCVWPARMRAAKRGCHEVPWNPTECVMNGVPRTCQVICQCTAQAPCVCVRCTRAPSGHSAVSLFRVVKRHHSCAPSSCCARLRTPRAAYCRPVVRWLPLLRTNGRLVLPLTACRIRKRPDTAATRFSKPASMAGQMRLLLQCSVTSTRMT